MRMGQEGQIERSILIRQVQPRKVVHLERWTGLFNTFPVGLNQSSHFFISEIWVELIVPIYCKFWIYVEALDSGFSSPG